MRGAWDAVDESCEERSFIRSPGVSHLAVTANAREALVVRAAAGIYLVSDFRMTMPARVLRYFSTARLHENRFMEIASRERIGMPKTVVGLRPIFAHKVMRRVAIVARSHRSVTGLHPGIK